MITFGIDLAAQRKKTAACRLRWADGGVGLDAPLDVGWDDHAILEASRDVDAIGIDAPFGFPRLITEALPQYARTGRFPEHAKDEQPEAWARRLRFRETDRAVNRHLADHHGVKLWPLSVSSDRIAVTAWRCAGLLTQLARMHDRPLDRVSAGDGVPRPRTVEVYPAAALAAWGLPSKGYKPGPSGSERSAAARAKRHAIVDGIRARLGRGLRLGAGERDRLIEDDDLLDAFVAALVTRAAALSRTVEPADDQRDLAREEGWIHLPAAPLSALV